MNDGRHDTGPARGGDDRYHTPSTSPRLRRLSWPIVTAALAVVITVPGVLHATQDLADAAMRGDAARLDALLAETVDVDTAQPDGATALHWAAYREDIDAVEKLLRAGANPDVVNVTGMTPLALAAINGDSTTIRRLLDAGAGVDGPLRNGETPLMLAARTGRTEPIELLLAHGADIAAAESLRGTTALMWAAAYGNADAVRLLIEHGADIAARSAVTSRGRGPYMAPPARERILEFIERRGLGDPRLDEGLDGEGSVGAAAEVTEERISAALRAIGTEVVPAPVRRRGEDDWGGLTPLIFAARHGHADAVEVLVEAGADVNQTNEDGWTALLAATHNRYYRLGIYLLEQGTDPNIANSGGWTPLYIATDNRNIEGGDYPVRQPDMDHLDYIRRLLAAGADPNLRMRSTTETRTVFTQQWLFEDGATPFLRAAQSGDLELMRLLLEHGADPDIPTVHGITPLMVAAAIGWVEGVTHEWSAEQSYETAEFLIKLGADVNAREQLDGRTALMGAAHKGRPEVVQLLVDHGADLATRDIGSRDSMHQLAGMTWQALDYAEGLVRVGVQSATAHPETAALIRRLMQERGMSLPPEGRTIDSICVVDICQ